MAKRESFTTLYNPETGTAVEVSEDSGRADVLKDRGYLDKAPKTARQRRPGARSTGTATTDQSAELEAKDQEIADLKAQLDQATAPPAPVPTDPKK